MIPTFTPNPQQSAVFSWATEETGSLNLIARAGCGKTSTLVELVKLISSPREQMKRAQSGLPSIRVFLGAFNKAIATELQQRIGNKPGIEAGTMHSLGFRLCRQIFERVESPDSRKVKSLAKALNPWDKKYCDALTDLVSYAKQAGFGVPGCPQIDLTKAWDELCDYHDIWDEVPAGISPERVVSDAKKIYRQSLDLCGQGRLDFDDMILCPLYFGGDHKPEMFDWVLIDEAQDTNVVRRKLAELVLKTGGRMVAVGDDRQAIYGFAGASSDSMTQIKTHMGSKELPLSVTYRCPREIVALAQTWVPDIQAHESAPKGSRTTISHTDFWNQPFDAADVILCRNTYPLIGIAQRLRTMGVPCVVEGNSTRAIVALVTKWGDIEVGALLVKLAEYLKDQKEKWQAKGRADKVEAVEERVDTVQDIAAGLGENEPVRKLVNRIENLFGQDREDSEPVLRLCTIHRAKGREWERVYLIGRNVYQPSKWAVKEWEIVQEENLMYVAVTRVKRELVEVNVPLKGRRDDLDWWDVDSTNRSPRPVL